MSSPSDSLIRLIYRAVLSAMHRFMAWFSQPPLPESSDRSCHRLPLPVSGLPGSPGASGMECRSMRLRGLRLCFRYALPARPLPSGILACALACVLCAAPFVHAATPLPESAAPGEAGSTIGDRSTWAPQGTQAPTDLPSTVALAGIGGAYSLNLFADGSPALQILDAADPGQTHPSWLRSPATIVSIGMRHQSRFFEIVGKISNTSDGKYTGMVDFTDRDKASYYMMLDEGGIGTGFGPLSLKVGRLKQYDFVDTPYSLAVNARGIAAPLINLAYDNGMFFFETRWIELSNASNQSTQAWPVGFPDRGGNLKTYGFRFPFAQGRIRFGFQDIAVYSGRSFDPEYLLNPLPSLLTQYVKYTVGRPWVTIYNDNALMGFFADYRRPGSFSLLGQVLVDDAYINIFDPDWATFPWQIALSLGASMETKAGTFGLYLAGSTKHTFEPNMTTAGSDPAADAYGYTYIPDSRFSDTPNGQTVYSAISVEDSMVGYLYGANTLAASLRWSGKPAGIDMKAGLEFRLAGQNSPTNPWGDYLSQVTGTHWLDDAVLEKRILASVEATKRFGAFGLSLALDAGVAFDALRLSAPVRPDSISEEVWNAASLVDRYSYLYRPTAGAIDPILRIRLGVTYALKIH